MALRYVAMIRYDLSFEWDGESWLRERAAAALEKITSGIRDGTLSDDNPGAAIVDGVSVEWSAKQRDNATRAVTQIGD